MQMDHKSIVKCTILPVKYTYFNGSLVYLDHMNALNLMPYEDSILDSIQFFFFRKTEGHIYLILVLRAINQSINQSNIIYIAHFMYKGFVPNLLHRLPWPKRPQSEPEATVARKNSLEDK